MLNGLNFVWKTTVGSPFDSVLLSSPWKIWKKWNEAFLSFSIIGQPQKELRTGFLGLHSLKMTVILLALCVILSSEPLRWVTKCDIEDEKESKQTVFYSTPQRPAPTVFWCPFLLSFFAFITVNLRQSSNCGFGKPYQMAQKKCLRTHKVTIGKETHFKCLQSVSPDWHQIKSSLVLVWIPDSYILFPLLFAFNRAYNCGAL